LWEREHAAGARAQLANLVLDGDSHRPAEAFGLGVRGNSWPLIEIRIEVPRNCIENVRPSSRSISRGWKCRPPSRTLLPA